MDALNAGAPPVEVRNLTKRYKGGTWANRDITLKIARGELLGILGPNGAQQDHAGTPDHHRAAAHVGGGPGLWTRSWYQNPMWSKVTWESCPRSQPLLGTYDPTPPAHLRQAARPTAQSRLSPRRAVDFQTCTWKSTGTSHMETAVRRSSARCLLLGIAALSESAPHGPGPADRGSRPTISP